jgi:Fe-S cluster assembly iron-binding protein IscA
MALHRQGENRLVLELTEQARQMIGQLRVRRGQPEAGLRIARRASGVGLWMSLTEAPDPDDVVIRVHDAVLYLDEAARRRLGGQVLDARSNAHGAAFFVKGNSHSGSPVRRLGASALRQDNRLETAVHS